MNPFENSVYNLLNDERRDLINRLPDMHKQARKDALTTIKQITIFMIHLTRRSTLTTKVGQRFRLNQHSVYAGPRIPAADTHDGGNHEIEISIGERQVCFKHRG